jgi:hypothetical protein
MQMEKILIITRRYCAQMTLTDSTKLTEPVHEFLIDDRSLILQQIL